MIRFALGALPLLAFLVWIAALYFHHGGRRNAVLQAAALLGLWVMIGTEGLSAINSLGFVPILIWWIIALIAGLLVLSSDQTEATAFASRSVPPGPRRWDLWLVSGLLIAVLALALASAVLSPPNNYDSYSYHLARQVMWLQHGNVRHYPTVNLRQLMMGPFTEFVGVQLMALSNSDRWINLVQYAALLVTLCGVSLLTERLGGDRSVQVLACLLLVVSPVVFLEASNTKNDMLVAMWLVISVYWLIGFLDGEKLTWFKVLLMGSAIGCGGDTKGTGGLFLIPIVAVLAFVVLRRFTPRGFKMLCAMGLLALAINLPQFGRNYFAFGHIDGPTPADGGYPLFNEEHGPAVMISNVTRLLVWEAAIGPDPRDKQQPDKPSTSPATRPAPGSTQPVASTTQAATQPVTGTTQPAMAQTQPADSRGGTSDSEPPSALAVARTKFDTGMLNGLTWLHEHVLHLGINDKRTTTPFSAYANIHFRGDDEDRAGAPALMLLLVLLPFMLWVARERIDISMSILVSAIAILGFLIFNWSVKWQEWHVRYFIAQIALLAPVLAVAFSARWRSVILPLLACVMCAVLIPTISNNVRALLGPGHLLARNSPREKLNFHNDLGRRFTYYGHQHDFMDVAKLVERRGFQWVGIATNGDFPDYAIMYTIKYRTHRLPNFEYVNPSQPRKRIPGYEPHVAEVIVSDVRITHLVDRATGVEYVLYRGNDFFNILLPKGDRSL